MTNGTDDTTRYQIMLFDAVHDYIREHPDVGAAEDKMTQGEFVDSILPENYEEIEWDHSDTGFLKTGEETRKKIDSMVGKRVSRGQIVTFYLFLDAIDRGDTEQFEEVLPYIAELLVAETGVMDDA